MKLPLEQINILCIVFGFLILVDGKGGGGGGGGRGGGGGGRGIGRGGARGLIKSRTAVILGSGAAGYAAYRAHKNLKKDKERGDKEGDGTDFDSFEQYINDQDSNFDYKAQESTSYYASEGIGMSAWALLALILGILGLGTLGWFCCNVFIPVWDDNRKMRRRAMLRRNPGLKDEVPLQETPSTATPSP